MFNSSKIGNSTNNTSIYNNSNETANGISRSFTQPKITSTPLIKRESIFATPPKHSLLSPKRYSLSEIATPPRSNRRDLKKVILTGPLLASTRYDVNVSTYEDTKSPGLAGRIVQYNEGTEQEREQTRPATHQAKYGIPGLFPVVHLFKKKLPTLEQRPRRVTVRIASPEHSRHHSQEYNRKLLEGIVKPSIQRHSESPFSPSNISNSSTRSVLDALKEISRKRIHANEEYDLNEDSGKRLRTMNNGDTNKRLRDDSSMEKSPSPGKPSSKRVCMYDEYAASCSSMDFSFKKMELPVTKRKSVSISTITENPKDAKQLKLKNAETQTVVENDEKSLVEKTSKDAEQENVVAEDESKKKKSPLKVFDDAPLERIRKNRLAALMGSLTGKEPVLLPKPDYASVLNSFVDSPDKPEASEAPKSTEKPLVSILKRSPIKSNKQVHFEVPESTSETNLNSTAVSSFPSISSSTSLTPLVSSASDTNLPLGVLSKSTSETPAPPSSPVNLQPTTSSAISLPVSTFETSTTSVVSKESSTTSVAVNNTTTELTVPTFQFKVPTTSTLSTNQFTLTASTTTASSSSVTSSPPKMGGFKFDLSNPVASTTSSNVTPTFSFGSSSQSNAIKPSSDFGSVPTSSIKPIQGSFTFGAKSTVATTSSASFSTTTSFGSNATTTPASSTVSTTPTFKFGASIVENKTPASSGFSIPSSAPITFNAPKTTTSTSSFGIATSTTLPASATPSTTVSSFGTTNSSFFSFGAPKTTSAPSGFGVPASAAASPITFGAPSTTSSSFGTPTSSILSTSAPSFGATTTSSALNIGFGTPTTTTAAFGSNTNSVFGANKVVSPFGAGTSVTPSFGTPSTTAASSFGKSTATQLGQSTMQSAFGTPTASMSFGASNAFGSTTTTASSVFGGSSNTSVFGVKSGGFGSSTNNSNIFGGAVNTQPSGFGTATSKPMFGTATTAPFGGTTTTTAVSSFGNSNAPSFNFGAKTTATPSFGSSFGTTTTASSGFGTSATSSFSSANSSFGSTNSFGSGNTFGATSAPAFGVATTSTQSSGFGTTNTPSFGTTGFNSTDKAPMFGSSSIPAFGSNTSSPFGTSTSTPPFGASNNTSGFGNSTAVSAFGKPQTAHNAFGAATPNSFGASNSFAAAQPQAPTFGATNTANTQNEVFSFGATTSPKPPGVFSFGAGASNEVPKPSFNFTGGNAAPPAFGGGATPSFGIAGPTSFGAGSAPQFNAPAAPTQGMFSIGSGSSTGKARTHLKPKRRT